MILLRKTTINDAPWKILFSALFLSFIGLVALNSISRFGLLFSSIGVGTAIMKTLASLILFVLMLQMDIQNILVNF